MKKKQTNRLLLRKRAITNLQSNTIIGGTVPSARCHYTTNYPQQG
jgi:hypothetical protein